MSTIAPGRLLDIEGVGDPVSVAQTNFEIITQELLEFNPTYQNGVETTVIGPPTSGTHTVDEKWKDAWLAEWRCTVAGTPGTWRQETPAVRAGEPASGTIPTNYVIVDSNENYVKKYHAGSFVWTDVYLTNAYLASLGQAGGIYWRNGSNVACTNTLTGILRGNGTSGPEVISSLTADRIARIGTSGQTLVNSIARDDGTYFAIGAAIDTGQQTFQVTGGISLIGASTIKTSIGELTIDTGNSLAINFKIGGSNGWRITSASNLQAVGAQTISTTTGNLSLTPGTGGNVYLNPDGAVAIDPIDVPTTVLGVGIRGLTVGNTSTTSRVTLISTTSSTTSALRFADGGGSNWDQGYILYNHSADQMDFGTARTKWWSITSVGILESNGAQTIQTSTGNLTLTTGAGNGDLILRRHGTGNVQFWANTGSVVNLYFYSNDGTNANASIQYDQVASDAGQLFFFTRASGGSLTWRWNITNSASNVWQSNGAGTIQTSTGALTIATAAGNGNIVLSPNGTGDVLPGADATTDLGSTSFRWATVHAAGLTATGSGSQIVVTLNNAGTGGKQYNILSTSNASGAYGGGVFAIRDATTDNDRFNIQSDGTIRIAYLTQHSVLFAGPSGSVSQGNIVWNASTNRLGLNTTTTPSFDLSLGGNSSRTIGMERHTTSDTAGNDLTIRAGGATVGATNKAGGNLVLVSGISTGTGDSSVLIYTYTDATETLVITVGTGVQIGAPTGGDKGAGTINVAGDIYKNNSAYTNPDYVFEHAYTGEIVLFKDNPGANEYRGRLPLEKLKSYTREHYRLPIIKDGPSGIFERGDVLLAALEEAYLYIFDLEDRISAVERN